MSTTTESPASMTRSESEWCGDAPFGPEPTITKSARRVALLDDRVGDRRARLAFGAAHLEELGHPGVDPVDRRTGLAERGDLVGALPHPQVADHPAGHLELGVRQGVSGRRASGSPTCGRRPPPGVASCTGSTASACASSVSPCVTIVIPASAAGDRSASGASSTGTTSTGDPSTGRTSAVRRSSGWASYPVR